MDNLRIYGHRLMKIYRISFNSPGELHLWLEGEPAVNGKIFLRQHSFLGDESFAGADYETALRYCLGGYGEHYGAVMALQKELEKYVPVRVYRRKKERALAGSHPNVPAFIAGSPKAMFRMERAEQKKFVNIYFNLAYPVITPPKAIINRGAAALSLVRLLEGQGMGVNFKVFMAVYSRDEIFMFEITYKPPGELLNIKKCCYPLCSKEFVRRIVFRVMESVPFENPDWYPNYGEPLSDEQFRSIFGISDNDMVISSPWDMGVKGNDIFTDSRNLLDKLGLEEYVRVLDGGDDIEERERNDCRNDYYRGMSLRLWEEIYRKG
ncbi:MAG: hypothetical protein NC078_10160 [Ruminococcus sp.]|nr:hypothetical protein [Ruminococcus sp.]